MSALNYKPSLALVLAHEGGYVNHPRDPGGATNQGVTQKVYDAFRRVHGRALQSVRYIKSDEVERIYREQYWKLVRGDSLPAGLDYAVFDFGVNSGISRAIRYLQRLVKVEDDAIIGNATLAAVYEAARKDERQLIMCYCANRMAFLKSLGTFPTFGKGWTRRVIGYQSGVQINDTGVIDYAVKMAEADRTYELPVAIGDKPNEIAGKAFASINDKDNFPIITESDLSKLAKQNDTINLKILLNSL